MWMRVEVDSLGGNGLAGREKVVAARRKVHETRFELVAGGREVGAVRGKDLAPRGITGAADSEIEGSEAMMIATRFLMAAPRVNPVCHRLPAFAVHRQHHAVSKTPKETGTFSRSEYAIGAWHARTLGKIFFHAQRAEYLELSMP